MRLVAVQRRLPGAHQPDGVVEDRVPQADGDLDRTIAPHARCVGTVIQGMSQQSRGGATEEDLGKVAGQAMKAWP